jgi:hypothetical protein|tara:strand:+ start:491 stop:820 length:330 start_codon:yes stop_codon:yes gene_type:complete
MASEVLKEKCVRAMTNSENTLLTAAAGHTYTILNISLCETGAADETFDLYLDPLGGSNDTYIYKAQALAANATFEHTTRIVMEATDVLYGITASAANVDVVITYLDQTL